MNSNKKRLRGVARLLRDYETELIFKSRAICK